MWWTVDSQAGQKQPSYSRKLIQRVEAVRTEPWAEIIKGEGTRGRQPLASALFWPPAPRFWKSSKALKIYMEALLMYCSL